MRVLFFSLFLLGMGIFCNLTSVENANAKKEWTTQTTDPNGASLTLGSSCKGSECTLKIMGDTSSVITLHHIPLANVTADYAAFG